EDFDIGHAIFCDVSEVECCGYMGCAESDNRGKYVDGTGHSYYHYATGKVSSSGCCHCLAGCDHDLETKDVEAEGECTYYDVTNTECQRGPLESTDSDTVGMLKCGTNGFAFEDGFVREHNVPASPPPPTEATDTTEVTVTVATMEVTFPDLTVEEADTEDFRAAFIASMEASAGEGSTCVINSISAGSVVIDTTVTFEDGVSTAAVESFLEVATDEPASIFEGSDNAVLAEAAATVAVETNGYTQEVVSDSDAGGDSDAAPAFMPLLALVAAVVALMA
ncbi:MAG: hypothetical protein CML60_10625, partial [Rhodobacteraceae bacterium]|nr:hypothetical protein [Paracoccaceae bacterium]